MLAAGDIVARVLTGGLSVPAEDFMGVELSVFIGVEFPEDEAGVPGSSDGPRRNAVFCCRLQRKGNMLNHLRQRRNHEG